MVEDFVRGNNTGEWGLKFGGGRGGGREEEEMVIA